MPQSPSSREGARRELLVRLKQRIETWASDYSAPLTALLQLSIVLANHLGTVKGRWRESHPSFGWDARSVLHETIEEIDLFARTANEGVALRAELFQWLAGVIAERFMRPLALEEQGPPAAAAVLETR